MPDAPTPLSDFAKSALALMTDNFKTLALCAVVAGVSFYVGHGCGKQEDAGKPVQCAPELQRILD